MSNRDLTDIERATYEWQMWIPGFGESSQKKLKSATVFVSRLGGVGGTAAYYLAAAGIGRLILAHGGNLKQSDLNRQLLMTQDWVGHPRIESATRRLKELNPRIDISAVNENVNPENARKLIADADVVLDGTPLFTERFAINEAAVSLRKPVVECAMFEFEGQVTTIVPGETPCLACLHPEVPEHWKRQFPLLGAVSGVVGSAGTVEVVKLLTGLGTPLKGTMLHCDLREMIFRRIKLQRKSDCRVCSHLHTAPQ